MRVTWRAAYWLYIGTAAECLCRTEAGWSRTWQHGAPRQKQVWVKRHARSFKDAGNVTEAKLSTSLALLENRRPRAPDLIRVDDRRTNDARRRRRNTPLVRPSRAALPPVTSPAGGRRAAAEGHAVLSSRRPSAASSSSLAWPVMISRWTTKRPLELTWWLVASLRN